VIYDFNREALAIDVDFSLLADRVVRSLDQIIEWRGKPVSIRSDNGPKYISGTLFVWIIFSPATRNRTLQPYGALRLTEPLPV